MKTDKVKIKKSNIEGKGVFAARSFKKNEVVLRWDILHILSKTAAKKITDDDKKYISFLNGKYILMKESEKYINHSCEANTTVKNFCDVALRDIKEGEEITSDYSKNLLPDTVMECKCESRKCKKKINC